MSEGSWFPGKPTLPSPEIWLEFGELFWSLALTLENPLGILALVPPLLSLSG